MIQKSISNEKHIAEEFFGKSNLKANLTKMIAGSPLVLFCKDSKIKDYFGDMADGLNVAFCNRSKPIQTDVGACIATDPMQYSENGKILATDDITYNNNGLKDIEHVIVLLVDKIGLTNDPSNYKVC